MLAPAPIMQVMYSAARHHKRAKPRGGAPMSQLHMIVTVAIMGRFGPRFSQDT
ncbi:hypothetical protein [Primorskyibacter flagellatus]|uniref:hypothetical protein n=1 Tax=Primorskyibacter flagellatus TaxID=1387277 RepID=UPI0015C49564|nr:hypothetical protein [Primorskyibacter flagellatus]